MRWVWVHQGPGVTHAVLTDAPALRQPDISGMQRPACGGMRGDDDSRWEVDPYGPRCKDCQRALAEALEAALTVPTAPVRVLLTVDCVVDPRAVNHARELLHSYVRRTKTFNQHGTAQVVLLEVEEGE